MSRKLNVAAICLIGLLPIPVRAAADRPPNLVIFFTYVALSTLDGKELMRAGGTNSPVLHRVVWDVSDYTERELVLRLVDRKKKAWAHLTFDDFSAEGRIDERATIQHRAKLKGNPNGRPLPSPGL